MSNLVLGGGGAAASGYDIDQSLRFDDDSTAYLSKTFTGTPTLSTKATISLWWKRGGIGDTGVNGGEQTLISWNTGLGNRAFLRSEGATDQLQFNIINGSGTYGLNIAPVQRDVSAWYHILGVIDTTQVTSTNRMKLYINGEQVTAFDSSSYPAQDETNIGFGEAEACNIGRDVKDSNTPIDGYLAEVHFIDGQALTQASFGKTDAATNQWKPIEVTGLTYGTNGFYQSYSSTELANSFTDSSSSAHTITANGDVANTRAQTKIGTSSIKFDGTGDYLEMAASSDWDFGTGELTIECWAYFNSLPDQMNTLWMSGNDTAPSSYNEQFSIWHWGAAPKISFLTNGGTWSGDTSSTTVTTGAWHHLAWSREGGYMRGFLDGVEQWEIASTEDIQYTTAQIGRGYYLAEKFIDGYIDEFRVSNVGRYTATFTDFGQDGGTISSPTQFTADSNTKLLIHSEDFNGGLGADSSGNKNDFAVTNLVATDQMIDTPTNNYCTLNPLSKVGATVYGEGNLYGSGVDYEEVRGTFQIPNEGKWYWEFYQGMPSSGLGYYDYTIIGISDPTNTGSSYLAAGKGCLYYGNTGGIYNPSPLASYGAAFTLHDIIGMAVDMDSNQMTFYKNNSSQGTVTISETPADKWVPAMTNAYQAGGVFNFGQDSSFAGNKTAQGNGGDGEDFYYTPPTGYVALNTDNLSDPAIALPTDHFNSVLYTGATAPNNVTGVGFSPDLFWNKSRTGTYQHMLYDTVRGVTKYLVSNDIDAEATDVNSLTSFDSDGVTLGSSGSSNATSIPYVGWNWKAGGAPTADNDNTTGAMDANSVSLNGSLQSAYTPSGSPTVYPKRMSINTTAGFSIATFTGNQTSGATVGHGLSQAPEMVIVKGTTFADGWGVYHFPGMGNTHGILLNSDVAEIDSVSYWNDTTASASVFSLGDDTMINKTDQTMLAYCFHSIEGYSKVGKYTGNENADGTFIYTGFKPAFVLNKDTTGANSWQIVDNKRNAYNLADNRLVPNSTAAASTNVDCYDFVSNGFKIRTADGNFNTNNNVYIYIAFAESPFKTSNAR